jgi:hypothetical protein
VAQVVECLLCKREVLNVNVESLSKYTLLTEADLEKLKSKHEVTGEGGGSTIAKLGGTYM